MPPNKLRNEDIESKLMGLFSACNWGEERLELFHRITERYATASVLAGMENHALEYNTSPNFNKLLKEVKRIDSLRLSGQLGTAKGTPVVFDEALSCNVRWYTHGRAWTLFTDIMSMERYDGSECEWREGEKEKRLKELEQLGVPYDQIRANYVR